MTVTWISWLKLLNIKIYAFLSTITIKYFAVPMPTIYNVHGQKLSSAEIKNIQGKKARIMMKDLISNKKYSKWVRGNYTK